MTSTQLPEVVTAAGSLLWGTGYSYSRKKKLSPKRRMITVTLDPRWKKPRKCFAIGRRIAPGLCAWLPFLWKHINYLLVSYQTFAWKLASLLGTRSWTSRSRYPIQFQADSTVAVKWPFSRHPQYSRYFHFDWLIVWEINVNQNLDKHSYGFWNGFIDRWKRQNSTCVESKQSGNVDFHDIDVW